MEKAHQTLREDGAELNKWFWTVINGMSIEQHAKLVAACGSSRLPAGGFSALQPPFRVDTSGEPVKNLRVRTPVTIARHTGIKAKRCSKESLKRSWSSMLVLASFKT